MKVLPTTQTVSLHRMKVFARLFQKAAQSRARSPRRARRRETPDTPFLVLFAAAPSKRTESVFSHNIPTTAHFLH